MARSALHSVRIGSALAVAACIATLCTGLSLAVPSRSAVEGAAADARAAFRRAPASTRDAEPAERDAVWRLGRMLFYDPVLSRSGGSSCATCHQAGHGWSNAVPRAIGDAGQRLAFKAPTLFGVASLDRLGWTGRFADMAGVTAFAITSPGNMALPLPEAVARLRQLPAYLDAFQAAFGDDGMDDARLLRALSTYVASLDADTPFDRWIGGDDAAVGAGAKRGFVVFTGKGGCAQCHSGPDLSDGSFHDIGTGGDELGRGTLFKSSLKLQHAFKTPSLRGVAERGPYMHDGSLATLRQVVELYDRGGIDRPSRADAIRPLGLSASDKADLIAFLETLSGEARYRLGRQGIGPESARRSSGQSDPVVP